LYPIFKDIYYQEYLVINIHHEDDVS